MSDTLPVSINQTNFPESMPILPLKGAVAFPLTLIPLSIGLERSVRLVEDAMHGNRLIFLTSQKNELVEVPGPAELYQVGTMSVIHQLVRNSDKTLRLVAQGLERGRIVKIISEKTLFDCSNRVFARSDDGRSRT